jgi:uncharacterized glyoxalase superfamily metalloenzyme YdcJ
MAALLAEGVTLQADRATEQGCQMMVAAAAPGGPGSLDQDAAISMGLMTAAWATAAVLTALAVINQPWPQRRSARGDLKLYLEEHQANHNGGCSCS